MFKRTILLTFALVSLPIWGQQSNDAVILGSVADVSQAAIPGAVVIITSTETAAVTKVQTDEHGDYRTPPLRIGEYRVAIEAPGFKQFAEGDVQLSIGDVRKIDAVLQIGQVTESVSVSAADTVLNTSDSTQGTVVGANLIQELPLTTQNNSATNGRDYLQLALLSAGTAPAVSGVGISIGGQAGYNVGFLLDGIDNNAQFIRYSYGNQKEALKPSVDAISQFKVVTNGYSADYGRSSSGVVSVSINSGTNQVHGTAYEFLRNDALDATPFFQPVKTPYRRNDFGAAIGGPIIKNKLFAFGDFELLRVIKSNAVKDSLPTASERAGCFSKPVYDPTSYNVTTGKRTAYPQVAISTVDCPAGSYQIPGGQFDPLAVKLLSFIPVPNSSVADTNTTNDYIYTSPANALPVTFDFRIDSNLTNTQKLFFRWSTQNQHYPPTISLPAVAGINYTPAQPTDDFAHSFAVGYDRIWSPTLISSIRVGWNYLRSVASSPTTSPNLNAALGFKGADTLIPGGLVSTSISNFTTIGGGGKGNITSTQTRQLSGDLTWAARQAHNLKFGFAQYWLQTNFDSAQQSEGTLSFTGNYTRQGISGANPFGGFPDFLTGQASGGSLSNLESVRDRQPLSALFALDDWRVTKRLTINYGLRYELNRPPLDKFNRTANDNIDLSGSPTLIVAGEYGNSRTSRSTIHLDHAQFAPRVGFAYSLPGDKTVIRGAWGLFYSNAQQPGGMQSLQINPPYHIQLSYSPPQTASSLTLAGGFPAGGLTLAGETNVLTVSDDTNGRWPRAQQWNLNVQRSLPGGILFEVGYAGNSLTGAWMQYDANQAFPGPGSANANRPFHTLAVTGTPYVIPSLADILRIGKVGYSYYNALQTKLEKRYSSGFSLLASYSYSKTISLGENQSNGVQNIHDFQADKSVSSQDMTHHLTASVVYDLPFGRGRQFGSWWNRYANAVAGGWSIDPIFTYSSGLPFNLTVTGNPSNAGTGLGGSNDRPNIVGDYRAAINPSTNTPTRTKAQWFNTAAFAANSPYTFGDAGRNILRTDGAVNVDLSAHKKIQLTERVNAQLRLEAFNIANHDVLAAPNAAVGSSSFGQVTSASSNARELQAAIKVSF
ncbi:MAG TPA: carboxypeptidase regulatory-like domain-containing protein [Acidobacteriaceae bacterium]|nr:carboxypeptidase regulatory-like domain-containing protein [Acidobacteriaceae bacterium]